MNLYLNAEWSRKLVLGKKKDGLPIKKNGKLMIQIILTFDYLVGTQKNYLNSR